MPSYLIPHFLFSYRRKKERSISEKLMAMALYLSQYRYRSNGTCVPCVWRECEILQTVQCQHISLNQNQSGWKYGPLHKWTLPTGSLLIFLLMLMMLDILVRDAFSLTHMIKYHIAWTRMRVCFGNADYRFFSKQTSRHVCLVTIFLSLCHE